MMQIEAGAVKAGVSVDTLMENAGLAVAKRARHYLGPVLGVSIVVLVGSGNNGTDGLVAARHLRRWGAKVKVFVCSARSAPDEKLGSLKESGVTVDDIYLKNNHSSVQQSFQQAHLVLDAVLGTNCTRELSGVIQQTFLLLNEIKLKNPSLKILAIDMPSGLIADTGWVDPAAPNVDWTLALGYPKLGHYLSPVEEKVGILEIGDIGIPEGLDDAIPLSLMTAEWARDILPMRPLNSHKGTFGKSLIVGGSSQYIGAPYLAVAAASRVGSGLVTAAIPESIKNPLALKATEATILPLPENAEGGVGIKATELILKRSEKYNAILLGCGLGMSQETKKMLEDLLYSNTDLPTTVVDADGLNILSGKTEWWRSFSTKAVITPHFNEMKRLLQTSDGFSPNERIDIARSTAKRWNKIIVLKGPYTVVADPDGGAMLSPFANPALATAGTGDVLAGVITGFLSQGLNIENAAALGVFVHGQAGDNIRRRTGSTGMIATDLLSELPYVIKGLADGSL